MARPPKAISAADRQRIETLGKAGKSARDIAAALKGRVSASTVGRLVRDIRGPQRARKAATAEQSGTVARPAPVAPPAPDSDAGEARDPVADVDDHILEIEALIGAAKADDNLAVAARLHSLKLSAIGMRERLRPAKAPDVEAFPDMISIAAQCRDKLRAMVRTAIEEAAK
jgi:hypothetical protein